MTLFTVLAMSNKIKVSRLLSSCNLVRINLVLHSVKVIKSGSKALISNSKLKMD